MLRLMLVVAGLALPCFAQSATVRVSHDQMGGTVMPGETIRITANIAWEGAAQWAGLKGEFLAVGDAGAASNVGSPIHPSVTVTLGFPDGGSVKGFDVASTPAYFTGGIVPPLPWSLSATGSNEFLWYDWTAPSVSSPTTISFDFVAHPIAPNVRLYPTSASPAFIEAPTTYIGTSILVVPAPAGLALLGVGAIGARRRARHASGI
ncbi:MAG: hypothetical protein KDA05_00535 [Phycisphaerales bacterium]|nr:hypothetical protein [Phycisphaerales bacterium]MCB9840999.1 hypothetical protein [Phycisphaeraceae bacterium]